MKPPGSLAGRLQVAVALFHRVLSHHAAFLVFQHVAVVHEGIRLRRLMIESHDEFGWLAGYNDGVLPSAVLFGRWLTAN